MVSQGGLPFAQQFVVGKISNCRVFLRRNAKVDASSIVDRLGVAAKEAERATSIQQLLGIEGSAARTYFQAFASLFGDQEKSPVRSFDFAGRNRRPPTDPVNALLSFGYALLTK